ncbi:MAG: ABC transporter permease [Proteobacteria bacterium]|nr:ABC transporter permease [Pseudomonadota bacterium]MCP4922253.1 ABC transporter permease [Pseudomonadota bacterium]
MNVLKMAWRNVWRNRRRSMITIVAMTLALSVELLYSGLVTGMFVDMENDVTEMDSGDIQVLHPDYLTRPSIYTTVPNDDEVVEKLEAAGYDAAPRLLSGGLAASGELSAGVAFVGVDAVRDTKALRLDTAIHEGTWLDPSDPYGVVVGRGLARTLALDVGSEVVVLSQAADGSMANELFVVRGILMSVAAGLDRTAILLPEDTFRELFAMPTGAHKIIVRRPDDIELNAAAQAVQEMVPDSNVITWAQLNPIVAQMLQGVQGMIVILYLIVYVAVGILVLNAMSMAVFERIREFGVLKAIGYSPTQVFSMMMFEGLIQAGVAAVVGGLVAAGPMWYLQVHGMDVAGLSGVQMMGVTMPPVWRGVYTLDTLMVPVVLLFFIVFMSVLYPALKAAWIRPVQAMHHQ